MKKFIRTLGLSLVVVFAVTSCSKDDSEVDNSLPAVTPSSLSGSYKVSIAKVAKPVDTNKDGFATHDLLVDGYNACGFDNVIEITPTTFSIIKKGIVCSANENNEVYDYKLDATAKTIQLFLNGVLIETINNVYLETNTTLNYQKYDAVLKQTIEVCI